MGAIQPAGDVVEDKNAGATGPRWAIFHAHADGRDGGGNRRTTLVRNSLLISKGVALSRIEFLPWFEPLIKTACDFSRAGATGLHLDNSRIHLYPDDFNPMCLEKETGDPAEMAFGLYAKEWACVCGAGRGWGGFAARVEQSAKPEFLGLIQDMRGILTPEIPKIAAARENIVEMAPRTTPTFARRITFPR